MRVGINPLSRSSIKPPSKHIAAVITHLPNMGGYHERRMDVIKLCLTSMRKHAGIDCQFYVWDNGSCNELRTWITSKFRPDFFTASPNIGKSNARKAIFSSFAPDTIIAMSDDDILFYPDWYKLQEKTRVHFGAVQVSGDPIRTSFRWGCENTIKNAPGKIKSGKFIPDGWEHDFAISIGRDPEWHKNYTAKDLDYRVTYKGVQAYCTGHHCQFIARVGDILPAMVWSDEAMADEKPFDIAVDKLGLRLCTTERLSRHIGNVIDAGIASEAQKFNLEV